MKLSIILPTFNEEGHIVDFIEAIRKNIPEEVKYEVIVVDDSKDRTGEVVQEKYKDDLSVKVFLRKKRGLATAILYGIEHSSGDHILLMDTDFNHDPAYIPRMIDMSKFYDIVSGSRYMWGGAMKMARFRFLGSKLFNKFVALTLGLNIADATAGFVLFKKSLLHNLDLKAIFQGYGEFCIKLVYTFKLKAASLIEFPVIYKARPTGKSKTNFTKYLFIYTWATIKTRFNGRKLIHSTN